MRICEITVYAGSMALPFQVQEVGEDFRERLADALEEGTVVLDTADGGKLILNALNVAAIEVRDSVLHRRKAQPHPPR